MLNKNYHSLLLATTSCLALALGGCGDSSGSSDSQTEVVTGVFVDSPVENINFATKSQKGSTNAKGEFSYKEGETVTFTIGDIDLPAAAAQEVVSPTTLAGTTDSTDTTAVNIARLLQTIDSDGDPNNGITVDATAHTAATGLTGVDFSSASFDSDVDSLVKNSGSPKTTLVTAADAIAHLDSQSVTLDLVVTSGSDGTQDFGTRTLIIGAPYTDADVSGKTYTLAPFGADPFTLEFYTDGSGTVTFGPGDTNVIAWHVADGKVYYTEGNAPSDTWDIVLTPIEATTAGENVLIEVSTPEGQADSLNGAGLGIFKEA